MRRAAGICVAAQSRRGRTRDSPSCQRRPRRRDAARDGRGRQVVGRRLLRRRLRPCAVSGPTEAGDVVLSDLVRRDRVTRSRVAARGRTYRRRRHSKDYRAGRRDSAKSGAGASPPGPPPRVRPQQGPRIRAFQARGERPRPHVAGGGLRRQRFAGRHVPVCAEHCVAALSRRQPRGACRHGRGRARLGRRRRQSCREFLAGLVHGQLRASHWPMWQGWSRRHSSHLRYGR
mmetsp:Transcript_109028/g.307300  ORF Transcript_109028/g.307300 Transcript_109028/m.307300 type:complete len:231 (+) Transcript_109028:1123-1815(+)